jgi:hypothetical protein
MQLGQKGILWFTDTLSPTQLIELLRRLKVLVTRHCGIPRYSRMNALRWAASFSTTRRS